MRVRAVPSPGPILIARTCIVRACAALLLVLAAMPALHAQSLNPGVQVIAPQQCVWRAGDDAAWAAPNLDESAWQPYGSDTERDEVPRFWIRCHLAADTFAGLNHPALEIRRQAAWQVFLDGAELGRNGNLESGELDINAIRILLVPPSLVGPHPTVIALKVVHRYLPFGSGLQPVAPEIRLGDGLALKNDRAGYLLSVMPAALSLDMPFIAMGLVGLVLLVFTMPKGSRPEAILLGITCVAAGLVFLALLCGTAMLNVPAWLCFGISSVAGAISFVAQFHLSFAIARQRIPAFFWLPMGAWILSAAWQLAEFLVPISLALRMDRIHSSYLTPASFCATTLLVAAPLTAFWPWNRVPPRIRTIAGAATVFALSQSLIFPLVVASFFYPNVIKGWMFPASSLAQLVAIVAIFALVLRDQRQVALDRAELSGEMQAAQQIQRTLVGESVESLRSVHIEVAFHPAREVGGDFYCCRVLPGDRQRILIGDVSGKGAAAAMAATLLMGASEERTDDSPAKLLAHLNRVLCRAHIGGFATCLCADLSTDGKLVIANAGHLAPYCKGQEIPLENGLPLGIVAEAEYLEQSQQLVSGDSLTLISDGVVEARGPAGELFGFDRMCEISVRSADEIAAAAKQFGQEDDITVLTVSFAG
jgi:hypothetical protein